MTDERVQLRLGAEADDAALDEFVASSDLGLVALAPGRMQVSTADERATLTFLTRPDGERVVVLEGEIAELAAKVVERLGATPLASSPPADVPAPLDAPVPLRPRLADGVWARRHFVDGEERVILRAPRFDGVIQLGSAAWRALELADGTRDHDAVRLACARDGLFWTGAELTGLFVSLHEHGFLCDGIGPPAAPAEPDRLPPHRPLEPLAGFALRCDGSGVCCRIYDTVAFQPLEAERARLLTLERGAKTTELFTPYLGAQLDRGTLVAACVDGRCTFLEEDGRCELQRRGGPEGKPFGCRLFPRACADDGEAIRVSVLPECACVFSSLGRDDGDPLVDPDITSGLARRLAVAVLHEPVFVGAGRTVSRRELRRWSTWLADELRATDDDAVALAWSLAAAVERDGLTQVMPPVTAPLEAEAGPWLTALRRAAAATVDDGTSWRSERDVRTAATRWLSSALESVAWEDVVRPADAPHERFYLLALNHAYRFTLEARTLAQGLRDRAVRLLAARAMAAVDQDAVTAPGALPRAAAALALVEALLRNSPLAGYASDAALPLASSEA